MSDSKPPAEGTPRTGAIIHGSDCIPAVYREDYDALLALYQAERQRCEEAERMVKNLAPTGRYNGLDIEQWMQRAEQAESRAASAYALLAELRAKNGKRPCDCQSCDCGNSGDTYSVGSWDGANWILGEVEAMLAASPPAATEGKP